MEPILSFVQTSTRITVVIPVFNNGEILIPSYHRLVAFFKDHVNDFGLLIVNDGSTDKSRFILDNLAKSDRRLQIIHLDRNRGQQVALGAGLEMVTTGAAVTTDIDLPVDLGDLLALIKKMDDGYDLVLGKRDKTHHVLSYRKWGSIFVNLLVKALFHQRITDFGCSCGAISARLLHRFRTENLPRWSMKLTLVLLADRFCEIPVHAIRQNGTKSSYSLRKLMLLALSIILYRFLKAKPKTFNLKEIPRIESNKLSDSK